MKAPVELGHLGHLVPRLKTARVGEQPQPRRGEPLLLLAHFRGRAAEGRAIGTETKYGDDAGAEIPCLRFQTSAAGAQLGAVELAGRDRHSIHQIGDADTKRRENGLLGRHQDMIGEASGMEQLPEPVTGPGEMQPQLTRPLPGVDPAEEDSQIRSNQVRNAEFSLDPARGRSWRLEGTEA